MICLPLASALRRHQRIAVHRRGPGVAAAFQLEVEFAALTVVVAQFVHVSGVAFTIVYGTFSVSRDIYNNQRHTAGRSKIFVYI